MGDEYVLHPDFIFGIELTITGLVIVFTALVVLSLLVWVFQKIDKPESQTAATPGETLAQPKPTTALEKMPSGDGIPPEVLAAIMAAATIATGSKIRITRVQYRTGPHDTAWSRQGRFAIMTSHSPKR